MLILTSLKTSKQSSRTNILSINQIRKFYMKNGEVLEFEFIIFSTISVSD